MKFKSLAVLALLLMAAPATAATVDINETAKANKQGIISSTSNVANIFSLAAGNYIFSLTGDAENGSKVNGSLTAVLKGISYAFEKTLTIKFGTNASTPSPISFALLNTGNFTIDWSGSAEKGTLAATAALKGQTVAVPGPEAGAGLGALAMAGVAYLVSRRRKVSVAA